MNNDNTKARRENWQRLIEIQSDLIECYERDPVENADRLREAWRDLHWFIEKLAEVEQAGEK